MAETNENGTGGEALAALFRDIKFFVSGKTDEKIVDLLRNGGAERMNYFSDYVTHLICGENPEENDVTDATDLYEVPAVTSKWVLMCVKLGKLISTKPYVYDPNKLFSNLVFCLAKPGRDRDALWGIITFFGGCVQLNFNKTCTHLVTVDVTCQKFEKAEKLGYVTVVTPDWVVESARNNSLAQPDLFHPKRIQWPKIVKHESTTAITGFEPEKGEVVEKTIESQVTDSTQALLDKLKQRMPWNQPQTTAGEVAPPNVVAPSFKNQPVRQPAATTFVQPPQSPVTSTSFAQPPPNIVPNQIPRSIVHHTPQIMQPQFNLPNQLQLNRLIGQQARPNLQQLRGQMPNNPIHQQILQQRMAQNQQNRPPMQLMPQQLANRQLIQNQSMMLNQPQIGQPQLGLNQQLGQNQMGLQQQNQQFSQQHLMQQQQQQNQILQQQKQAFQQQNQQVVQNQPNLAIQQFGQNQQFNQNFGQNQPDLGQQQQFPLLNQQNQFAQQQQQQQPRPQINQMWQQQQAQQPVRPPLNIVQQQQPRLQWSPNQQQPNQLPQRQFIQLDAQTHNQLQKMPPEQQALFVAKLQKQKQLLMQKQMQQQRAGGGSHILIRGSVPPGLNPQQQMQWLQQQAKQQGVVLPPNIQQQTITPAITQPTIPQNIQQQQQQQQHAPGLSPIQQNQPPQFNNEQQNQLQLRQYRLQQLQLQREQKNQLVAQQQQQQQVRPLGPVVAADSTTNQQPVQDANVTSQQQQQQHPLVVNAKTKTALANMLQVRLQSGGGNVPETIAEPSAAGTLRLMTAQHNAALNPNNRPQDLIALQQRRVISGPNGEIIRPPVPQPVPVVAPNDPPKLQFSPRATVPLQHRPGPFYGHNPNLKLPPDLFLLGCIFCVVEVENYLNESQAGWQQKIEQHGGEIEKQYCSRVTHVLCETQRHGVVMQALRDCKRCVSIYWLADVLKRKQVLPPWTALHLPIITLDVSPLGKHLVCISGFEGTERYRVRNMIDYMGAKFTPYFSKHNTLLIAGKGEGSKYTHAKKWGTPVVNVQWLTDIMLGNFTALNQMEHIMYQQFSTPHNFSFDPKWVPNLMHAWKAPINISQESYERVKRSASPVLLPKKPKKIKVETIDENDNFNNESTATNPNYRILFSTSTDLKGLQTIVRQLGGILAKSHQDCTHLVMPSLARTNKLLYCACRDVKFVPEQWLRDSQTAGKFLDDTNYTLETKDFNSEYKCDFAATLATKNRNKLFDGKFFWVTPSVHPTKAMIVELIQSCGGIVERIRRSSAQIEATNINAPYSYIIITHDEDMHLVWDLLRNKKDDIHYICCAELIFSAILRQTFEVEPFAVKVL